MSDANDILKKMREEKKTAVAPKISDNESFYPRLIIFKLRRRQLSLALIIAFCAFCTIVAKASRSEKPWWAAGLPIAVLGLIISVIPPTEEWEYKPWQARARQYERHQIEK